MNNNYRFLEKACGEGNNYNVISEFIKNNDIDKIKLTLNRSLLSIAIIYQNIDIIELLLRNKINVNNHDDSGWSPLRYAIQYSKRNLSKGEKIITIIKNHGGKL